MKKLISDARRVQAEIDHFQRQRNNMSSEELVEIAESKRIKLRLSIEEDERRLGIDGYPPDHVNFEPAIMHTNATNAFTESGLTYNVNGKLVPKERQALITDQNNSLEG